jgi:hypothetical protein
MYIIESCKSKLTKAHELPFNKAFTIKGYTFPVYIRVEPVDTPQEDTVTLIEFNGTGDFVSTFTVEANLTYSNVMCHNFTIKLLP